MTKIKVYIEREEKTKTVSLDGIPTVRMLLEHLKINPVTVITTKNGEVCEADEMLSSRDNVKIISVVSGG
tara:strand:- start:6159 stop:6368 length:210 start_codon:yes stop_codon:yes gene_type:complete